MLLSLWITKFPLQMSYLLNVCGISTSNSCEIQLHVFRIEESQTCELKEFYLCLNPCDFHIEMGFWNAWLSHSVDSEVCLWPCLYSAFCSIREEGQSPRRLEDRDCSHPGAHLLTYHGRRVWPRTQTAQQHTCLLTLSSSLSFSCFTPLAPWVSFVICS